jgi:membrane associated rhomboid family serine protease
VQADVGSQCLDCYRSGRPDARTRARYWNARQPALVTYVLIGINVAVFVWMAAQDSANLSGRRITEQDLDLGLVKFMAYRLGPISPIETIGTAEGEWYRVVSSAFLHFGILHIAFNLLLLFQLGLMLEPVVGRVRFGLVYLAALLGGSAGVLVVSPYELTGGASGAVFGLLGAAAVAMHQRGVNPLTTGVGAMIMLNVLITFTLPNVSIGGHLGGLAAGAIAGWFAAVPKPRRYPIAVTYAAPVAVAVIAAGIAYVAGR